jgi:hypothetical protein
MKLYAEAKPNLEAFRQLTCPSFHFFQIFPAGEVEIEETWLALLPITAVEVALRTMDI